MSSSWEQKCTFLSPPLIYELSKSTFGYSLIFIPTAWYHIWHTVAIQIYRMNRVQINDVLSFYIMMIFSFQEIAQIIFLSLNLHQPMFSHYNSCISISSISRLQCVSSELWLGNEIFYLEGNIIFLFTKSVNITLHIFLWDEKKMLSLFQYS